MLLMWASVQPWRFRDHHRFSAVELAHAPARAGLIVTTAKDAVRLPSDWKPDLPVLVLRAKAVVSPAPAFWRLVDAALTPPPAERLP